MNRASVWIDVCNSPHVLFFEPIIAELRHRGIEVLITAQDFGQTIALLDLHRMPYRMIGGQTGKSILSKARVTLGRSLRLAQIIRKERPALLVSHGSRSGVIAASLLRIPAITIDDYEHSFTRINNILSEILLFPSVIPIDALVVAGVPRAKIRQYPGFKEEVYLAEYQNQGKGDVHGVRIPEKAVIVLVRPPATTAHYHNQQSDLLFSSVIQYLKEHPEAFTLVVGRNFSQQEMLEKILGGEARFHVIKGAVDGLALLLKVDLMIGGGGTMNREAAILGIPTYSFFAGKRPAIDRALEDMGMLRFLTTEEDVRSIAIRKKDSDHPSRPPSRNGLVAIVDQIQVLLKESGGRP